MTRDEIIEMARQAGFKMENSAAIQAAKAFAALVAAKEREACAELCETGVDTEHPTVKGHIMNNFGACPILAKAIRARGE